MLENTVEILHLEDDPQDCELVAAMLEEAGLSCITRAVETGDQFRTQLLERQPDLILSDFSMPAYDGLRALHFAQENCPSVPFIFFSGTLGEEAAVAGLRDGATDYVLKQRPGRLVASVRRALAEAASRRRREEAEEQLRDQAALLDEARDAICVLGLNQRIVYWNRAAERLYGWPREEALGRDVNELLIQADATTAAREEFLRRGEWEGEIQQVTRSGRRVTVESRWSLVRDVHGLPKSILVLNTDISERKSIEAQYLRAQRLESVGLLAGGIAHDLNNLLAPIVMSAELLLSEKDPQDIRSLLEGVAASAQRGTDLIRQILSFARGVRGDKAPLDLRHVIHEVAALISSTFPRAIELKLLVDPELPLIRGDVTQLHQVLLNLCMNARDAMPQGGRLTIEAVSSVYESLQTSLRSEPLVGRYVELRVTDTGAGIPEELLPRIFDPFFSTKEASKGTGLGLSTVVGIVRGHEGSLEVRTSPGQGTTFTCYFPAAPLGSERGVTPAAPLAPVLPSGKESVLLVDDETLILDVTRKALLSAGYRVSTARDGAEALQKIRAQPNAVDLVVTDMMMPTMDGPALIAELRRISPGLRIIAVSGLFSAFDPAEITVDAMLHKPFGAADLLRAIQAVLAAPKG